jgi:hypothetical protein
VARLLTERAEKLRTELRALDAMFAEVAEMKLPELFSVESRFRRHMLQAELDFVASLAADIAAGTYPGTGLWRRLHELRDEGVPWHEVLADPVAHLGEEAAAIPPQHPTSGR